MHEPPIHDAASEQPRQWATVRVWLADGTLEHATWTGRDWRTEDGIVEVVRWQRFRDVYSLTTALHGCEVAG